MNLYEINQEIRAILHSDDMQQYAEENSGDIPQDVLDKLTALEMDKKRKAVYIAQLIINLRADAEAYNRERQKFEKLQRSTLTKITSLLGWLEYSLDPGEKVVADDRTVSVSFRESKYVDVYDASKLPARFIRQANPEPAKHELMRALSAGEDICGARIATRKSVVVK